MPTELELLQQIGEKVDATTKQGKEVKELAEAAQKEAAETKKKTEDFLKELETKGATIVEMQGEIKELKAKSGRMKGEAAPRTDIKQLISDTILEYKDKIKTGYDGEVFKGKMEMKVVGPILSANLTGTGNNYISYLDWRPGMEPIGQFRFRSLCRTIQSETDFVRFPRANVPVGEGSFGVTAEGSTKPQVDRDYTMIDVTLGTMAGYAIVSRQSLRNIVFLQSWLPTSMMEQLLDAEDSEFGNALIAAATGSATVQTGFAGVPEKLISYIKNLLVTKFRPNAIAVDPAVWAALLVFQPGRTLTGAPAATVPYSNPFVVTVDTNGIVRVLGIPVYPVNWLTGGRVIVGDWTKVAIVESEGLTMRQSDSHASIFTANEIAFLLERVQNIAVFRPDAFVSAVMT